MPTEVILTRLNRWLQKPHATALSDSRRRLPCYTELCRRWEAGHWSAHALDFGEDWQQWRRLARYEQKAWNDRVVGVLRGEVAATEALAVYLGAMAVREQGLYIATQIADEARHVTLFERFQQAVRGVEDEGNVPPGAGTWTDGDYRRLIAETLPALCSRLRTDPRDEATLVEAVALLHFLIEGGLGMSRLRSLARALARFPALHRGLVLAGRDEVRHYLFGLRFLHDAVRKEPAHAHIVVRTLAAHLPAVMRVLQPAGNEECEGVLRRLERGLRAIGPDIRLAA
jgi:ribonucleoside-diphosphate reductase beta chain